MFITLTRCKKEKTGWVESPVCFNRDYIIEVKKREDADGSILVISFPDTVRTYLVKEQFEEVVRMLGSQSKIFY